MQGRKCTVTLGARKRLYLPSMPCFKMAFLFSVRKKRERTLFTLEVPVLQVMTVSVTIQFRPGEKTLLAIFALEVLKF